VPIAAGLYYSIYEGATRSQNTIVLVHGAGSSHLCWPAELRRLSGHTVIALDLPGHGRSGGNGCQSAAAYCAALLEFMAALGLYRAAFVGHSLGGAIALNMALDYSQHVRALGLISSGASFNIPADLLVYLSSPTTSSAAIQGLHKRMFGAGANPALITRSLKTLEASRRSVLYGDWLACAQFDVSIRISEITIPVYIACGGEDRLTPPTQSRFLAGMLPQARLDLLPEAGHLLMLEKPAAIASGLKTHFEKQLGWQSGYSLPVDLPKKVAAQLQNREG